MTEDHLNNDQTWRRYWLSLLSLEEGIIRGISAARDGLEVLLHQKARFGCFRNFEHLTDYCPWIRGPVGLSDPLVSIATTLFL